MKHLLQQQLLASRAAAQALSQLSTQKKNQVLGKIAQALWRDRSIILRANARDLKALPPDYPLFDRLRLTTERIQAMADSVAAVRSLPDPINEVLERVQRPSGLDIRRVRVPLGVIAIIYEARPNVTTEVFSLTFKTGNSVVLKGSRDAAQTNVCLVQSMQRVLRAAKLPRDSVTLVNPFDRVAVDQMLGAHGYIDVIIPRGSSRLINYVREHATVPVIETGAGVCHTLVEKSADVGLATKVIMNAKTRRPTVCNALDCVVIEQSISKKLLAQLAPALAAQQVEILADQASYTILRHIYPRPLLKKAQSQDFGREFLALRLAIKTVPHFTAGLHFIQEHTSHHSEAIITRQPKLAQQFTQQIDAAAVYVNTSTAFTDGFEFGLGAEMGISTQKLHARGPMGLKELTTYKWVIQSQGAVRTP